MPSRIVVVVALAVLGIATAGDRLDAQGGHELFQQALSKERAEGKLEDAIRLYVRITDEFATDRPLAARALLEMGRCYEKLGHLEARKAYERLVRDYSDQADLTARAKVRLAVLARSDSAATGAPPVGAAAPTPLPRIDIVNDLQALSPDGKKATYISYDKGQNLAVYDFATKRSTRITNFDWSVSPGSSVASGSDAASVSGWASFGVWSPDGRRVAYMQSGWHPDAISEVRVATLDGQSQVIFRNEAHRGRSVRPASWLPDGRALVVVLERSDRTIAIGSIPATGGQFTPIRSLQWAGGRFDAPHVSPDGRFIAFAEGAAGMRDIQIVSVDGRTAYRGTDHPGEDFNPMWSPDGRHLVFISNRYGASALWAVAIKDGRLDGDAFRVRSGMQDVNLVGWTQHGLAYVQHLRTDDIYTVPLNRLTGQPAGGAQQLPYGRTGRNIGPVWSPDGRLLAFVSSMPAEPNRRYLVLLPAEGGEPREFLIPTTQYQFPQAPYDLRWFGNGSGLGFSGSDVKGEPTLFRLTLATGEWKTTALPVKPWTRIEWNTDGSRYFYARQGFSGESATILDRDLTTGAERVVFPGSPASSAIRALRVAPDRHSLAFTSSRIDGEHATIRLMVVDLKTNVARTIIEEKSGTTAETSVSVGPPTWSPDGRALLVTRTQKMVTELLMIPLDGGAARSVSLDRAFVERARAHTGELASTIRDVVWSPDGSSLALVRSSARLDAWLLGQPIANVTSPAPRQ